MSEEKVNFKEITDALDFNISDKSLVQDNKLNFMFNKILYRVRMPNQRELAESKNIYHSAKIQLLKSGNVLSEEQLREVLKKNNIDIESLENKLNELDIELVQTAISLSHKKDSEVTAIIKLKAEIKNIKDKRYEIAEKIAEHLSSSLENQAKDKQYEFLTAVCTEKYNVEDNKGIWNKTWNTIEDYEKDDTNLHYIALGNLTKLILTT